MASKLIIDRIPPDMHVDEKGNIVWTPRLIDFNAAAYSRGHVVTSDEFNTELIKQTYQGNYNTDTISVLIGLYNDLKTNVTNTANTANTNAAEALLKAGIAEANSIEALGTANDAFTTSTEALSDAQTAVNASVEAITTSENALNISESAMSLAEDASDRADAAVLDAEEAMRIAEIADDTSVTAEEKAAQALSISQLASSTANSANTKSDSAVTSAENAVKTANEALKNVTESLGTQVTVGGQLVKTFNADSKVNVETGKGLSSNDFTDTLLTKLNGIAEGANKTIIDTALSATSTNPIQNKIIKSALDGKLSTTGNAVSATKSTQDGDGNVITDTYLKLSGGIITGDLSVKGQIKFPNDVPTDNDSSWIYVCKNSSAKQGFGAMSISTLKNKFADTYLKLTGGTLTGSLQVKKGTDWSQVQIYSAGNVYHAFEANDNIIRLDCRNFSGAGTDNRRILDINCSRQKTDPNTAVAIWTAYTSLLKTGSIIKSGSKLNGTTYSTDTTLNADLTITASSTLKTGSTVKVNSIVNGNKYTADTVTTADITLTRNAGTTNYLLTDARVKNYTSLGALAGTTTWSGSTAIPTLNTIAWWDGRYASNGNASNLKYAQTPSTTDNSKRIATTEWVRSADAMKTGLTDAVNNQHDTVVKYWMNSDGTEWYRIWASGFKEWGMLKSNSSNTDDVSITFTNFSFSSSNYIIQTNMRGGKASGGTADTTLAVRAAGLVHTQTTTGFTFQALARNYMLYACGI